MKLYVKRHALMLLLFSVIALCTTLDASASEMPSEVVPLGIVTGIEIETDGAIVTGFCGESSPGKAAGVEIGDMIIRIDDLKISSGTDLRYACARLDNKPVEITVRRGEESRDITVYPKCGDSGKYELGLTVRDGLSGIGTMTFFDPATGIFGALGHGVTEADGNAQIPLRAGTITKAVVTGIIKGVSGNPGRIMGLPDAKMYAGSVNINTKFGIFGIADCDCAFDAELMPIAGPDEVHCGQAMILSNIGGEGVKEYAVEVVKLYGQNPDGRNMSIKVTDAELLKMTGGIIQGMSGSPIIQDGKLIGAVTHVLVGDPAKGYGIYIGNMIAASD